MLMRDIIFTTIKLNFHSHQAHLLSYRFIVIDYQYYCDGDGITYNTAYTAYFKTMERQNSGVWYNAHLYFLISTVTHLTISITLNARDRHTAVIYSFTKTQL